MKKIIILLFLVFFMFSLASCSNNNYDLIQDASSINGLINSLNNSLTNSNYNHYNVSSFFVSGVSMSPMLDDGEEVFLIRDYYKNNSPVKGDLVAYDYAGNDNYLIKMVRATDKDKVELVDGSIFINGEVMKNSVEEVYSFGSRDLKMLKLYIVNGSIPEDSYLIFGDNVGASLDSRNFGAVSKEDFVGKFILK